MAASWLHLSQPQLSRIESGPAVRDLARLTQWTGLLGVPKNLLWFTPGREQNGHPEHVMSSSSRPCDPHDVPDRMIVSTAQISRMELGGTTLLSGLQGILAAHIQADAMLGPLLLLNAITSHAPVVEQICRTAGEDRSRVLVFATEFVEFCGWLFQDVGDFTCATKWTNRALDYALELGDPRVTAYVLMRKSNIATESGDPDHGLTLANAALATAPQLTPRLRAVILRQRLHAHALLPHTDSRHRFQQDVELALAEVNDSLSQEEPDRAGYCTPAYIEMEIGASLLRAGRAHDALPVLQAHHSRGLDPMQARDRVLGLARLATAYAALGERDQACQVTVEAVQAVDTIRSWRVGTQLNTLEASLSRWSGDRSVEEVRGKVRAAAKAPWPTPN